MNKQTESLKKSIDNASQKSKQAIKTLIESNSKQFDSAIESNKKTFDSISKMIYEKEMDPSIIGTIKSTFVKSIKMSEDVIDSIIDSHTTRIDFSIDFISRFTEIIRNEDVNTKEGINKLIVLVDDNFNESTQLSMKNMEKIIEAYNGNINLALNFNKKFADTIHAQITSMFQLQSRNVSPLEMVTEWWKNIEEEKVKA